MKVMRNGVFLIQKFILPKELENIVSTGPSADCPMKMPFELIFEMSTLDEIVLPYRRQALEAGRLLSQNGASRQFCRRLYARL